MMRCQVKTPYAKRKALAGRDNEITAAIATSAGDLETKINSLDPPDPPPAEKRLKKSNQSNFNLQC
jgi:hypothetical protein